MLHNSTNLFLHACITMFFCKKCFDKQQQPVIWLEIINNLWYQKELKEK